MTEPRPSGSPTLASAVAFAFAFAALTMTAACSDMKSPTQATTSPPVSPPAQAPRSSPLANGANWLADATVVSSSGSTCGWGTSTGETRSSVQWKITRQGEAIVLDEDMPNWPTDDIPFKGSVSGAHFVAQDIEPGEGVCAFRGGELTGTFSDDRLTFEASETLRWGSLEHPAVVERRWTGHALTVSANSAAPR